MPQPLNVETVCTGCKVHYLTTKRQATEPHHFHDKHCYVKWRIGRPRSDRGVKAISRTCEFCGTSFRAGGRDENGKRLPNKNARFHNKVCAGRAKKVRTQRCRRLSKRAAEWHSWFFDSEGSTFMVGSQGKRLFPVVSIGSTNRNVILSLIRDTGVGEPTKRRAKSGKQKDLYQWRCFAGAAITYLRQILPYSVVKRAIIEKTLRWCGELVRNPQLGYSREWRVKVLRASKDLNARGAVSPTIQRLLTGSRAVEEEIESLIRLDLYESASAINADFNPSSKVCLCCGNRLPSGNRTACSRECGYMVRRRKGEPCRVIHPSLCSRLAGLVDGEGCIGIARSGNTIHVRVDIGSTDERLVRLLQRITGIGSIVERPPKKKEHSVSWHWRVQCDGAEGFLQQIAPYLRIKDSQAALALEVQGRLSLPANRVSRNWQKPAMLKMHRLNKKGPSL